MDGRILKTTWCFFPAQVAGPSVDEIGVVNSKMVEFWTKNDIDTVLFLKKSQKEEGPKENEFLCSRNGKSKFGLVLCWQH